MASGDNRTVILTSRPTGKPTLDDFELVTGPIPTPDTGEVLVRTLYIAVAPYMRDRIREYDSYAETWALGDPMRANAVGEVVEATTDDVRPGDMVVGQLEWAEYCAVDASDVRTVDSELAEAASWASTLGSSGRTAYVGLFDIGRPKPGDSVLISGGAGAVGSVVGQLAKLCGCHVVGIAGSDEKVAYMTEDLGFDAGINYAKTDALVEAITNACPRGVDLYYDNVGGPITDAAMVCLNDRASVVVCGQISVYNAEGSPHDEMGPRHLWRVVQKEIRIEGFLIREYTGRFEQIEEQLARWIQRGDLTERRTIADGLAEAPRAFIGLFDGENIGKQLVKVHGWA